jgi:restriction endonuclease S subunit
MVELTIPNEWLKVNISDLADVDLGKTPNKTDYLSAGDYKVVKFRDVDYSGIDWANDKDGFVGASSVDDLRELKLYDVLITASAHSSEHIGRKICFVAKLPKDYKKIYFCGELLGISAKNDFLSPKFCFYYFLSHTGYKEIQSHVKGVHLTSGQARNMSIPFTPPPEQNCIIEIVEELFSDLDNAIENLEKAQEQLKVYRQAVLKYAFEGKLMKDSTCFKNVEMGLACEAAQNINKSVNPEEHFLYIDIGCIDNSVNRIVSYKEYLWKNAPSRAKQVIKSGDVLFATVRTYLKNIAMVPVEYDGQIGSTGFCVIRPKKDILDSKYIFHYVLWDKFINTISTFQTGTSYPAVRDDDIFSQTIPLPDLPVQKKIVEEIESRFSVCDKLEESINENLQKAEALRQSILKQAFEGKLTEQWRRKHKDLISGGNSAEALLQKIKVEKETLNNKPKGKKTGD